MTRAGIVAVFLLMVALLTGCTTEPQPLTPGGGGSDGGANGETPVDENQVAALIAATVQVDIYGEDRNGDGDLDRLGHGSGTILTADGLILTNAHVAAPDAPGQAVQYGFPGPDAPVERLVVRLTESEDAAPVERYRASVVAVDGYLDIALIQIEAMADGSHLNPSSLDLPFIPIGDSDELRAGEELIVVGFPGIGGETVSVDHGDVSGFQDDDHIGQRGWIKTSAVVHFGNSGGLAANADGEIVGVPTRAPDAANPEDVGGFQLLRPIKLAMPVIDAAMSGTEYGRSPHLVYESGRESVTFRGWGDPDGTSCAEDDLVTGYPSGATVVKPIFDWSNVEPGLDVMVRLIRNPADAETRRILRSARGMWDRDATGTCLAFTWSDQEGFQDGTYVAAFYLGPDLRPIAQGSMVIPAETEPADDEVTLSGTIVDAGNGQAIGGALVFALKPGTDAGAWFADPTPEAIAASAKTAADGSYEFSRPLTIGTVYPLLIYADGYSTWRGTLTIGGAGTIGPVGLTRSTP